MFQKFSKLGSLVTALAMPMSAHGGPATQSENQATQGSAILDGISGHFGSWYDSGSASNSPAGLSQNAAFWGFDLVLTKELGQQSFNLTFQNQLSLNSANDLTEFDLFLQWSRQFNDNLTLSLGLNNYFYPEAVNSTNSYHELETRVDYIFNSISAYFYLDQECKQNGYLYAALGASYEPIEICKGLSFTPGVELSTILRAGEVYTKSGLDNLALAGTLTYQMDENSPQVYFTLSVNRGFAPEREKLAPGFIIGIQNDF